MTAEIMIMNKEAIALAADSAVTTFGTQKIFTSANKLFSLSKFHPVGIMIYGNASLMGIPWQTLIKIYRKKIGSTEYNSLQEYATNFIDFLSSDVISIPDDVQKEYIKFSIYSYFDFVNKLINKQMDNNFNQGKTMTEDDVKKVVTEVIQNQYNTWTNTSNVTSIPSEFNQIIIEQNKDIIKQGIIDIFGNLPIRTKQKNQLQKICGDIFAKFPIKTTKHSISGVVIAGFGKDDIFPAYVAYEIDCIINHNLKYKKFDQHKIDFNNYGILQPFAQSEMVFTFMEGVNPYYMNLQSDYLTEILKDYSGWIFDNLTNHCNASEKKRVKKIMENINSDILTEYQKNLENYRKKHFSQPITQVITVLPKDELAEMAESLVNITSFKRRVSMDSETVGGPIDVAVISKGDGFIWIKRKHYFTPDLNNKFFQNYYNQ